MARIRYKPLGEQKFLEGNVDLSNRTITADSGTVSLPNGGFDIPATGTVYGTLLNYKGELEAFGEVFTKPPYNQPPQAPILYIKPQNTLIATNIPVPLPQAVDKIQVGAALGIVIGETATRVKKEEAFAYIAGYTIANDISVPYDSVFRPGVKHRSRDGFCPIGPWIVSQNDIPNPDNLDIRVFVNRTLRQANNTRNLVRSIARLLADVTEFMTLYRGDTLLVGTPEQAPLVSANDEVRIEIEGIGWLQNKVQPEHKQVLEGAQ
ncbi:fumarylacetoacetate hydrolase family protein [Alicyclobacillus sp. SO9]|uniref:fumarylacetoacetate hydrolase family protein n=1 Tax=Alicyclobacillus sp. SO9 TaxID=2665646 RepID=UPI0018E726D6|nr:fumarylacetoacetate hydrolase family protein [Alicyclobacillus sp. SO9]QQE79795.1 fumarylacetoacetate hydrolase family protein [Alicyclobacillus sp. SO9]